MMNRLSNVTCLLALMAVLAVAGCKSEYKEEAVVLNPLIDPNYVVSDYASRAIEATGGRQAWLKAERLDFDCVVTFYRPDGTFYLTQQHYEINPWLNSIRISAQEPLSKLVWQLSDGRFSILSGDKGFDVSPVAGFHRDFAEAVLNIITAPVRFLDKSVEFTKVSRPVKIEGRWYYPIEQANLDETGIKPYWSKVVFYQSTDTSLVDVLWFADVEKKKFLAVRSYEYREIEKNGVLVPAKIEIFKTDARGDLRQRLAKIDFK